jgi:hypothetical protein
LPSLSLFNPDKENTGALAIVGYFVNIIGIISSIPTLLTGFAELYGMVNKRELYVVDQKTGVRKREGSPYTRESNEETSFWKFSSAGPGAWRNIKHRSAGDSLRHGFT